MGWSAISSAAAAVTCLACHGAAADQHPHWKYSCFAYRGIDRDGIYGMGDRPFAGLVMVLTGDDGRETLETSNIDGFANFTTARGDPGAAASEAGSYAMRAEPPEGWHATSGAAQALSFRAEAVVPGGLAIVETCEPVGIAPDLAIGGRIVAPQGIDIADITVSATDPAGSILALRLGADGSYSLQGSAGNWTIAAIVKDGAPRERTVELARSAVHLSAIDFADEPFAAGRRERTIDFDDLTSAGGILEMPSGYGGLDWRNWIAVHNRFYEGEGYVNGTRSGEFVAYNSSGTPATISRNLPFDFLGAAVTAAWPRGREGDVVVRAWSGDELRYSDRFAITPAGGLEFAAEYLAVTRVEFSHEVFERIVIDDLRIRD